VLGEISRKPGPSWKNREASPACKNLHNRIFLISPERILPPPAERSSYAREALPEDSDISRSPPREDLRLRFHGQQVWIAGLRNVAAEAAFIAAVVVGERNLLQVAPGNRADYMN
jgi:hypothetical protein